MGKHFHVDHFVLQHLLRKVGPGNRQAGEVGCGQHLDQVKSFGVKKFEDFTWKHMLDFYSCADCGRCSDQCPANAVGRPLSPRFLTIKARDYGFRHYPLFGRAKTNGANGNANGDPCRRHLFGR